MRVFELELGDEAGGLEKELKDGDIKVPR